MAQITCEYCQHVNPHGTILCESCGKPLQEDRTREFLTMRYEGSARRSQTYKKTIVDKIWNSFSSVKVGVTLIVLTFIASAIGTIFPQAKMLRGKDPAQFYEENYGIFGQIYYQLGFHELYGSVWFIVLIGLLGLSVIIASLDRGIPLHRALKNQRVTKHNVFLRRQRVFSKTSVTEQDQLMSDAKEILKKRRYKIREENGNVFAEKHQFARWGAYVNHVGLIIIMIAAMLRFFPGMYYDENFWVREGQTKAIPGTNEEYFIKNHNFIVETYNKDSKRFAEAVRTPSGPKMIAKNFQTNVTLYEKVGDVPLGQEPELKKIKEAQIQVNHPLEYSNFSVYQVDFMNQFSKMSFTLQNKDTGETYGSFTVNLVKNQKPVYYLGDRNDGYKVKLLGYFPDFYFNDEGQPATKSSIPNNPAFIFEMFTPKTPNGETSFVKIRQNVAIKGPNEYKLSFAGVDMVQFSGLNVHRDYTIWPMALGGLIFMIGVIQGLYWQYRRIWLKRNDDEIWFAGTTNKNWYGLTNEMNELAKSVNLQEVEDRLNKNDKTE